MTDPPKPGSREALEAVMMDISSICNDAPVFYNEHPELITGNVAKRFGFSDDFIEQSRASLIAKGEVALGTTLA